MTAFAYSTRPADATLNAWFQNLEPEARDLPLSSTRCKSPSGTTAIPGQFAAACLANEEVQTELPGVARLPQAGGLRPAARVPHGV